MYSRIPDRFNFIFLYETNNFWIANVNKAIATASQICGSVRKRSGTDTLEAHADGTPVVSMTLYCADTLETRADRTPVVSTGTMLCRHSMHTSNGASNLGELTSGYTSEIRKGQRKQPGELDIC